MLLSLIICKIILKSKLKLREYTVFSEKLAHGLNFFEIRVTNCFLLMNLLIHFGKFTSIGCRVEY